MPKVFAAAPASTWIILLSDDHCTRARTAMEPLPTMPRRPLAHAQWEWLRPSLYHNTVSAASSAPLQAVVHYGTRV